MRMRLWGGIIRLGILGVAFSAALGLSGCGNSPLVPSTSLNTSSLPDPLAFQITIAPQSTGYTVGCKVTNQSDQSMTLIFPKSPVSYLYHVADSQGNPVSDFQDGILDSLTSYTLHPGESLDRASFTFEKPTNSAYQVFATLSYYLDNTFNQKVISKTF